MSALIVVFSIYLLIQSAVLIGVCLKAQRLEDMIMIIDGYLKKKIREETGQRIYKDR